MVKSFSSLWLCSTIVDVLFSGESLLYCNKCCLLLFDASEENCDEEYWESEDKEYLWSAWGASLWSVSLQLIFVNRRLISYWDPIWDHWLLLITTGYVRWCNIYERWCLFWWTNWRACLWEACNVWWWSTILMFFFHPVQLLPAWSKSLLQLRAINVRLKASIAVIGVVSRYNMHY